MEKYKITIKNYCGIVLYSIIIDARNGSAAVIKAIEHNDIILYDGDRIEIEEV